MACIFKSLFWSWSLWLELGQSLPFHANLIHAVIFVIAIVIVIVVLHLHILPFLWLPPAILIQLPLPPGRVGSASQVVKFPPIISKFEVLEGTFHEVVDKLACTGRESAPGWRCKLLVHQLHPASMQKLADCLCFLNWRCLTVLVLKIAHCAAFAVLSFRGLEILVPVFSIPELDLWVFLWGQGRFFRRGGQGLRKWGAGVNLERVCIA